MKANTLNKIKNKLFDLTNNEYNIISDEPKDGKLLLKHNKCQYEWYVKINNFFSGSRCPKCAGLAKPTIDYLKSYFEENNCTLLSNEYKNNSTKLEYICNCGAVGNTSWLKFKSGQRCGKCRINRIKNTKLLKYGDQNFNNINKIKETNLKKYGVQCVLQNEEVKNKVKKTMLKKYGIENYFHKNPNYSKISQELFWNIYNNLSNELKNKTYFAELNNEFASYGNEFYLYDFVISNIKICIEFHGNNFHPQCHLNDNDIGWHAIYKNLTVKEARKYEFKKNNFLINNGYEVLIIWENDYKKNKDLILNKCLEFINKERG